MEVPTLKEPCSLTASLVSDESLHHRFNILKKTNQQTKELNFSLFNQDKERLDVWLRNLEPHLVRCNTIKMKMPFIFSDKVMITASHVLYKLTQLKSLKVNAMGSKLVSNKGLITLNQTLSKLQKLSSLKLDFSRCPKISDQAITNLGQSIYRLQNLTSLSLIFSGCERITNDSVIKLGLKLAKLTKLTHLTLVFSNCPEINDEGVSRLFQSISTLTNLTHLTYKFYRCPLTDKSLVTIGEKAPNLKNLRKMSLTTSSETQTSFEGITSVGTNALCQDLYKLKDLETLTVKFGWSDTLDDKALIALNQGIHKIENLRSLQLGFYYCHGITDDGPKLITEQLHKLENLKCFKINLWTCDRVSDDILIDLGWDLSRLPGLEKCQLASEKFGWMTFNKRELLSFAMKQSVKRFARNICSNKIVITMLLFSVFIMGFLLLASISGILLLE